MGNFETISEDARARTRARNDSRRLFTKLRSLRHRAYALDAMMFRVFSLPTISGIMTIEEDRKRVRERERERERESERDRERVKLSDRGTRAREG
jgi:hypothetical protein